MNIFDAFALMNRGYTIKDKYGKFYKEDHGKLLESTDGLTWKISTNFSLEPLDNFWSLVH